MTPSRRSILGVPRPAAPQVERSEGSAVGCLLEGPRSTPWILQATESTLARRFSGDSNRSRTNRIEQNRFSRGVIDFERFSERITVVAARFESASRHTCTV